MAFGAVGFGGLRKCLLAIVADPAVFILPVGLFGHLQVLLLHGKNLGVAVRALGFVRAHMGFVAEDNRVRSLGGELDLPSPNLLRLSKSDSQGDETNDANANDRDFPNFHTRPFPLFLKRIKKCLLFKNLYTATLIPAKAVIPAKAGIQEKTGFRAKPGMTNAIIFMSSCIITAFRIKLSLSSRRKPRQGKKFFMVGQTVSEIRPNPPFKKGGQGGFLAGPR